MRISFQRWGFLGPLSQDCRNSRALGGRSYRLTRLYSSSHDGIVETFNIACGSAGHVTVDIHNADALSSPNTPLIIYLPPAGFHLRSIHPPIPSFLLRNSRRDNPLAQINYRWNHIAPTPSSPSPALLSSSPKFANYPFPTPLHDILHAWSWLTEEYLTSLSSRENDSSYPSPPSSPYSYTQKPPRRRPLLVYGSYLGGTLATSLALTESYASKNAPINVHGLIVQNGIFDWTGVATSKDPNLHPSSAGPGAEKAAPAAAASTDPLALINANRPWETQTLQALKTRLFSRPASCFDSFASPTLFFRTAGLSIPSFFPGTPPPQPPLAASPQTDVAGLSLSDPERADLLSMIGAEPDDSSPVKDDMDDVVIEQTRRSHLKFPPQTSGLKIPRSLFLYSASGSRSRSGNGSKTKGKGAGADGEEGGEMERQTKEIVRLMRRSIVTHEFKDRVKWDEDLDPHGASEERVRIEEIKGGDGDGDQQGEIVGAWIEDLD